MRLLTALGCCCGAQRHPAQEATRTVIRQLVAKGQLEFNLGGLCMNDEATTHYYSSIAQMTHGAQFIHSLFGPAARPRVGWHIGGRLASTGDHQRAPPSLTRPHARDASSCHADPFGHSSAIASLWSAIGFDGYAINRIDYRLKSALKANQSLEFVWRTNPSLGPASDVWVHVMDSHYCSPAECAYDTEHLAINTNGALPTFGTNQVEQGEKFVNMARQRRQWYRHDLVLIPFGAYGGRSMQRPGGSHRRRRRGVCLRSVRTPSLLRIGAE